MPNISVAEKEILQLLYNIKDSIDIYRFFIKYNITPWEMSKAVDKLTKLNVIQYDNYRIQLTDYGKKWLLANRYRIFFSQKHHDWKSIPEDMLVEIIDKNQPYMPSKLKLDNNFFFGKK